MKKQLMIVCVIILLITVGFSGCNEETKIKDTDEDGYPDEIDDYPNDSNLYKKIIWYQFENIELAYNTFYPLDTSYREISSDVKYVEWTWNLVNLTFPEAKIQFDMSRMIENYLFVMYSITGRTDTNRISVNKEDTGLWTCSWYYTTEENYGNLYLSATVYIVK